MYDFKESEQGPDTEEDREQKAESPNTPEDNISLANTSRCEFVDLTDAEVVIGQILDRAAEGAELRVPSLSPKWQEDEWRVES